MSGEAIVARIDKVEEIPDANTIQIAYVLGERCIVGKDSKVGDIGILFPAETQLSEEYCHRNNLYRHSDKNANTDQKGFFEDNRKVRAMKFMKVKSEAYFAPITSVDFATWSELKVGDRFKEFNGVKICDKFLSPKSVSSIKNRPARKKIETPLFHQHVDTEQFKYYVDKIPVGATLSFHAKVHGTSARYSHTIVKQPPSSIKERILDLVGLYNNERWDFVAGTRRVILYQSDHEKMGFNGPESWRLEWLEKLKPHLNRGVTVYGEIVGYANGSPIMAKHDVTLLKDKRYEEKYGKEIVYKYGCPEGTNRFIVYRVTYTTIDGNEIDLSVDQMRHWCEVRGLEHTKLVGVPCKYTGAADYVRDYVEGLTERTDSWQGAELTEDWYDASHISEGIVIRVDYKDTTPTFYKNKSFAFKVLEGIANLTEVDLEDVS